MPIHPTKKRIFKILLTALILTMVFLYHIARDAGDPEVFAIVKMAWGLIFLWVGVGGCLMYKFRATVRQYVLRLPFPWPVTFVVFATILALLEEAIAVAMTNLAPVFGVPLGTAFITASTNYFEVIFFHSVIVFIPLFIAWTWILSRYRFSPFAVFLIFGLVGIVGESTIAGPVNAIIGFAQWIFVYGLMVYLPAYCLPERPLARTVSWYHHLLAFPATFIIAAPLLIPIAIFISSLDRPALL